MAILTNTFSHISTTVVPISEADPVWWEEFTKRIGKSLNDSVIAMNKHVESLIPTYYIRYEDLVINPEPVLMELFAFMLNA